MIQKEVGVATLLFNAATQRGDGWLYTLSGGDLATMARHATFLRENGFEIGFNDVYPALQTRDEKKRALQMLYDHWIPGWCCYHRDLVEYGICTEEEYRARLKGETCS
jgi:hypothetical protein